MATFHISMAVGISASTMPHLNYICREGKYSDKAEDFVYASSGNLPDWAKGKEDFWHEVSKEDYRSCRKIRFALPNELSREQQLELVREYVQEVIPNHPYTYAIHENDSAIYGEKNPHVHIMFSERIIDERTRGLDRREFFKKRGKTKTGKEYGGSKKNRDWAGNGKTKQIFRVRQALEDKINERYKKLGINKQVSCKTLERQRQDCLAKGDIAQSNKFDRLPPIRLEESTFSKHKREIVNRVFNDEQGDIADPFVQKRIFQERTKLIKDKIYQAILAENERLQPNVSEQFAAVEQLQKSDSLAGLGLGDNSQLEEFHKSRARQLEDKKQALEAQNTSMPVRVAVVAKTMVELERELAFKPRDKIDYLKEFALVDLALEKSNQLLAELGKYNHEQTENKLIQQKSGKELKQNKEKIRSKESLIEYCKKIGKSTEGLGREIENLEAQQRALTEKTRQDVQDDCKQLNLAVQKEEANLYGAIGLYQQDFKVLQKLYTLTPEDYKKVDEYKKYYSRPDIRELTKLYNKEFSPPEIKAAGKNVAEVVPGRKNPYKDKRIEKINEQVQKRSQELNAAAKELAAAKLPPINYYNKIMNEKTNGEYGKILEQIRSKESLIDYNKRLGNDISQLLAEKKGLEQQRERLKYKYGGDKVVAKGRELAAAELRKIPELRRKYEKIYEVVEKDLRRKYVTPETKSAVGMVSKVARKIAGLNDPQIGAASITTGTVERTIGRGRELGM